MENDYINEELEQDEQANLQDSSSDVNRAIDNLLSGVEGEAFEAFLKDNKADNITDLFAKIDKSKLLHLQALILAKNENAIAVEEANVYRQSINYYIITISVLGLISACTFWAFSEEIMWALGTYQVLTGVVFSCAIGSLASPFTSIYFKIKRLINEIY